MVAVPDDAEARRKGSIGSRGARTYNAPHHGSGPQNHGPGAAVDDREAGSVRHKRTDADAGRKNRTCTVRGMAKGLIGGLLAGGLIGALLGGGLGSLGGAGMLTALIQVALIGGLIWLLLRMFRRKPALATAHAGAHHREMASPFGGFAPRPAPQQPFSRAFSPAAVPVAGEEIEIEIGNADRQDFERLLSEVQNAYANEDFSRLRELTTPEVMSYFAEELSQNATAGRRNSVSGTTLIDAEVAEAWREESADYATIAMRYESIDLMLDRNSGAVLEGDPEQPSRTVELWTFRRAFDGHWRLSAIQEA
ncbi:TIM44-like domain-containing protein [Novosphingobium panipatense]